MQVGAPLGRGVLLPSVIGRQVKLAGAARNVDAAADAHQPFVAGQHLTGLALERIEAAEGMVNAAGDGVQHALSNAGVASVSLQQGAVTVQLLEQVALEVGARRDVHDFEDGGQRKVVVNRRIS